jgi:hypothetical protein
MSIPTNLLHTETTTQVGTRRLASSLEELEDPKEEGSYGDASKNVHGAKMLHRASFQPDPEPTPKELGLGLDQKHNIFH